MSKIGRMKKKNQKEERPPLPLTAIMVAGAVLIGIIIFSLVGIRVDIGAGYLTVKGPLYKEEIPYGDIVEVSLRDDVELGKRMVGMVAIGCQAGGYKNGEFGAYHAAYYPRNEVYIVVRRIQGTFLVFNARTAAATEELYYSLLKYTRGST